MNQPFKYDNGIYLDSADSEWTSITSRLGYFRLTGDNLKIRFKRLMKWFGESGAGKCIGNRFNTPGDIIEVVESSGSPYYHSSFIIFQSHEYRDLDDYGFYAYDINGVKRNCLCITSGVNFTIDPIESLEIMADLLKDD
jgi:hypothetical protein